MTLCKAAFSSTLASTISAGLCGVSLEAIGSDLELKEVSVDSKTVRGTITLADDIIVPDTWALGNYEWNGWNYPTGIERWWKPWVKAMFA